MVDGVAQYHNKLCSADVAVQAIKSHNRVFMTGNCSVPKELLGALVRRAPELEDVEIVQVLTIGPADYVAPEMQGTSGSTRSSSATTCARR